MKRIINYIHYLTVLMRVKWTAVAVWQKSLRVKTEIFIKPLFSFLSVKTKWQIFFIEYAYEVEGALIVCADHRSLYNGWRRDQPRAILLKSRVFGMHELFLTLGHHITLCISKSLPDHLDPMIRIGLCEKLAYLFKTRHVSVFFLILYLRNILQRSEAFWITIIKKCMCHL